MISPTRLVAGVLFCIGLASFGVLAWAAGKVFPMVLVAFGLFGAFCMLLGWHLALVPEAPLPPVPQTPAADKRVARSRWCSAAGVALILLAVVLPEWMYPVVLLFAGLALLAVAHALTPCVERMEQLRRARADMRQL